MAVADMGGNIRLSDRDKWRSHPRPQLRMWRVRLVEAGESAAVGGAGRVESPVHVRRPVT